MTREEIIRNLKYTMKKHENDKVDTFGTNISLMCKDILNYLEQQPCNDAISRQAVDKLSKELVHTTRDKADFLCNFWEGLQKLPPVTPQPTECLKAQAKKQVMPMSCDDCCYKPNSPFCEMYRKDICERKDERQSGKWIRIDKNKCKCDQCEVISFIAMYPNGDANYCPNCGCRMVDLQESEEV